MEGNAVVAIPAVKDGLFGVTWNRTCLMEGALRVMGFTCGVEVKRLEINCAVGLAILFGTYDHAVAPCDGLSYRHWFKDTQRDVLVESCLDFFLPVEWYWYWSVVCNWFCCRVNH